MVVTRMVQSKPIQVNNKGMITIPADLREKYDIRPGAMLSILEINGHLEIVPIVDIERLRKHTAGEFMKSIEDSHEKEIGLENEN